MQTQQPQEAKTPDQTSHDCLSAINEQLAKHNTQVACAINFKTGSLAIQVATAKLDTGKRGKPMSLYASFCPFCGIKLEA